MQIPFYDLKGLLDDSEIKDERGIFEEDSLLDDKKSPLEMILDPKKTK
jgi:hypothetical protein